MQLWDEREKQLKELEGALFQLHDDTDTPIPSLFTAIGDRMTGARVAAYEGAIAQLEALKVARAASIDSLCNEIVELWHEMEVEPAGGDEIEAHIREQREGMGWGQAVVDTLAAKLGLLQEERVSTGTDLWSLHVYPWSTRMCVWYLRSCCAVRTTSLLKHKGIHPPMVLPLLLIAPPVMLVYVRVQGLREEKITVMGRQITELWKRLSTSESEQNAFLEDHAGLGEGTILAVSVCVLYPDANWFRLA